MTLTKKNVNNNGVGGGGDVCGRGDLQAFVSEMLRMREWHAFLSQSHSQFRKITYLILS
jgi:hypothetical protein